MSAFGRAVVVAACWLPAAALAQESKSLDELLQKVKLGYAADQAMLKKREAEFKDARDRQAALLAAAEKDLADAKARSAGLEKTFQANELRLTELEDTLETRLGTMGELFGVVRQVAGDTTAQLSTSMVSAQLTNRTPRIEKLAESASLPSIEELEHLWFTLQQEMTESGKVARFSAPVVDAYGTTSTQSVVRIGAFNAISGGQYLLYEPEVQRLIVPTRQPPGRYLSAARELEAAESGFVRFGLDPSRGVILGLLIDAPNLWERVKDGKTIGYLVIALGVFAGLVGVIRLLGLLLTNLKVARQLKSRVVRGDNPVGRLLEVYAQNRDLAPEDLERKLDEVILRESARLDQFLWVVKVGAVAAPLMGLLGTVTGMIKTFQAITLFGTGDAKLMAGGISEALVTTMLGLMVAIPLVLFHAVLTNLSRRLVEIVEEQAAGVVARLAEADEDG